VTIYPCLPFLTGVEDCGLNLVDGFLKNNSFDVRKTIPFSLSSPDHDPTTCIMPWTLLREKFELTDAMGTLTFVQPIFPGNLFHCDYPIGQKMFLSVKDIFPRHLSFALKYKVMLKSVRSRTIDCYPKLLILYKALSGKSEYTKLFTDKSANDSFNGQWAKISYYQGCFLGGASYILKVTDYGPIPVHHIPLNDTVVFYNIQRRKDNVPYTAIIPMHTGWYGVATTFDLSGYATMRVTLGGPSCQKISSFGNVQLILKEYFHFHYSYGKSYVHFRNTTRFYWKTQSEDFTAEVRITMDFQHSISSYNCHLNYSFQHEHFPILHFPWRAFHTYEDFKIHSGRSTEYYISYPRRCSHYSCYLWVQQETVSWENASDYCSQYNGSLFTIKDYQTWMQMSTRIELNFLHNYETDMLFLMLNTSLVFIGLKYHLEVSGYKNKINILCTTQT